MCWQAGAERCALVVAEWKGEAGRLGVRRQETGEQGSPSECRKDKKEREGKTLHYQLKENRGKECGGCGLC